MNILKTEFTHVVYDVKPLTLGRLQEMLMTLPKDKWCELGFGRPDSYRGYYDQVAFPQESRTVGEMLEYIDEALTSTFEGWKGGEYQYDVDTIVNFADVGCTSKYEGRMSEQMYESIFE